MRDRQRLGKILLRRNVRYTLGNKAWTGKYWKWLQTLSFDQPALKAVFTDSLLAMTQLEEHIKTVNGQIEACAFAEDKPERARIGWLRCFVFVGSIR